MTGLTVGSRAQSWVFPNGASTAYAMTPAIWGGTDSTFLASVLNTGVLAVGDFSNVVANGMARDSAAFPLSFRLIPTAGIYAASPICEVAPATSVVNLPPVWDAALAATAAAAPAGASTP
jgi:hypothetical protein